MRRVLVLSAHHGQVDRRILAEVNTLAAAGRDVTLISVPAASPGDGLDRRVRLIMDAPADKGRPVKAPWPVRIARRLPQGLRDRLRGARYVLKIGSDPLARDYFARAADGQTFDAIHCHDLPTLPVGLGLRDRLSPGAKVIYGAHELFPYQSHVPGFQRYWSGIETAAIRRADLVITVNESLARRLGEQYGIETPAVIYNSYGSMPERAPLSRAEFLAHFGAPEGAFAVLLQGGLSDDRNLLNLVKAFGRLDPSTALLLLGGGPMAGRLRRLCRRRGIANVFFGDWLPQEDLLRYVRHADLGVIPYTDSRLLNNRYCTPNKLFEFIEAQVPICAADLPELRRIIRGQGIGDVYPMESVRDIARAVADGRARCERGEFTRAARRAARETFAWERQGRNLLALYDRLKV